MIRRFFLPLCISFLVCTLFSAHAFPNELQDLQVLKKKVKTAVEQHLISVYGREKLEKDIEIHVSELDRRLSLPKCDREIHVRVNEVKHGVRMLPARVSCRGEARWAIFIQTRVEIFDTIAVTTRNLLKGDRVQENDIHFRRAATSHLGGNYLHSDALIVGKVLRRNLRSGATLKNRDLQSPKVVKKGDTVVVMAYSQTVEVSSKGTALNDGEVGQQIQIRNRKSKRVVDALVTGPGTATIAM